MDKEMADKLERAAQIKPSPYDTPVIHEAIAALRASSDTAAVARAMAVEEAAQVADESANRHRMDKESLDGLIATHGQTRDRHACMQAAATGIADRIRALSVLTAEQRERMVERIFKLIVTADCVDEINPDYADKFWNSRTAEHHGDCTKQPQTCLRCRAEAFDELSRAVLAAVVGEQK